MLPADDSEPSACQWNPNSRLSFSSWANYASTDELKKALVQAKKLSRQVRDAENELYMANRRLVAKHIKPYLWTGSVWWKDFLQEGSQALVQAIRGNDLNQQRPFYVYATRVITNRIRKFFRDRVRQGALPVRPGRDMVRIQEAIERWTSENGEKPDDETLSEITGLKRERVSSLRMLVGLGQRNGRTLSLDQPIGESGTSSLHDLFEDTSVSLVSDQVTVEELKAAIEKLSNERYKTILRMRLLEGNTLQEVGDTLNLTRPRIKQLQDKATERLRNNLRVEIPAHSPE